MSKGLEVRAKTYKVVLLGEVNVGKTSVFQRLRTGRFADWSAASIGLDQHEREYDVDGIKVKLQVWDTAGSEKYRTLSANYYHSSAACLYMYDLTEEESLFGLSTWLDDGRRFQPNHLGFLIGNKCDVEGEEVAISEATIQSFFQEHGFEASFQMSAKSGQGVDACFHEVARALVGSMSSAVMEQQNLKERDDDSCC